VKELVFKPHQKSKTVLWRWTVCINNQDCSKRLVWWCGSYVSRLQSLFSQTRDWHEKRESPSVYRCAESMPDRCLGHSWKQGMQSWTVFTEASAAYDIMEHWRDVLKFTMTSHHTDFNFLYTFLYLLTVSWTPIRNLRLYYALHMK